MNILIIDDDVKFARYLADDLQNTYGHRVTWLKSADQALANLREIRFDVIILDSMMPVPTDWSREDKDEADFGLSTGLVLFNKIKKIIPLIPILIYTAKEIIPPDGSFVKVIRKPSLNSEIHEALLSFKIKQR